MPPGVLEAAEGLRHAVHRLAEGDGDGVVLVAEFVLPGGDKEKTTGSTEGDVLGRGVVEDGETVVGDENSGVTVMDGLVDDGLLALGNTRRDEDGAL